MLHILITILIGGGMTFYNNGYCHQSTIDIKNIDKNIVRVKELDGKWHEFKIASLPDTFVKWSQSRRLEMLEGIKKGKFPEYLEGPHNGMVATYGGKRKDSPISINNAVKGMGFMPRKDKIKQLIKTLSDTKDSSFQKKIQVLEDLYRTPDSFFTRKGLISLELYTTKDFQTKTYLNEMTFPEVAIVFLDIPTFQVKAAVNLICPDDPANTEYQNDLLTYANLIHSYFHGHFTRKFIAAVYNVVAVFNSSPEKGGMGTRIE